MLSGRMTLIGKKSVKKSQQFFHLWCYPTPFKGWRSGRIPRRPNSWATPQGLDQRSKNRRVPKMARRWGPDCVLYFVSPFLSI